MASLLEKLCTKSDIDNAIKSTEELVLVLRFGRESDLVCMELDEILWKTAAGLSKMAKIFSVEVDGASVYMQYFDITLIPATIFFFNGQHMKVDWGTPDHTKFIGSFRNKQDFIDVVEVIYRGAMRGKLMVKNPLDPQNVPKYELLYKEF
ncbi:PREDICTED: thioredoxin-like protein 4B [Priapulus caudatus]|uniref:Thioredoxin-like protein n=1 Tax=Priapulus caudatus TaxID=37621 RepID=A0ABM1EN15_PRICU|nr:PREDICTED: thioredoxin-like protein 4B [Priapulus caudatus]